MEVRITETDDVKNLWLSHPSVEGHDMFFELRHELQEYHALQWDTRREEWFIPKEEYEYLNMIERQNEAANTLYKKFLFRLETTEARTIMFKYNKTFDFNASWNLSSVENYSDDLSDFIEINMPKEWRCDSKAKTQFK